MRNAQEATGRARIEKGYPTTTFGQAIEFERLLKPFKGDVFGYAGGKFSGFTGGAENA
jgi:hypothetical protein